MPSISMKPLVPSTPGPPKDPKSFCAPWPAIREPCATRTIIGADSLTFEVFTLTPSVAFSGLASLVLVGRGRPCLRSIPETIWVHHLGSTSILPLALIHLLLSVLCRRALCERFGSVRAWAAAPLRLRLVRAVYAPRTPRSPTRSRSGSRFFPATRPSGRYCPALLAPDP